MKVPSNAKASVIGIEEKNFPKVFEIFKRIDGISTPGEGMGLAYLKKLVKRHDGRLDFTSTFGEGSLFFFTIAHNLTAQDEVHAC